MALNGLGEVGLEGTVRSIPIGHFGLQARDEGLWEFWTGRLAFR